MTTYKLFGASLIAASLALMGCDDHKKAKEEAHKVEESVKQGAETVTEEAKKVEEKVEHAAEAVKEEVAGAHHDAPKTEEHKADEHKAEEHHAAPAEGAAAQPAAH